VNPIVLNGVRYGIPAVLLIAGMVVWATGGNVGMTGMLAWPGCLRQLERHLPGYDA